MKIKIYLLSFGLIVSSAFSVYFAAVSTAQQTANEKYKCTIQSEYEIGGVLYMQKAAEYRALAYQAFNTAKMQLDADFDKKNLKSLTRDERKKPRAVIVDIDETVLDNSPQQVHLIKNNLSFNDNIWYDWGKMRSAKAIPGAVDFLKYADSKGVKVFYVSNRDKDPQLQDTIENLKSVGFPNASETSVLLRENKASSKSARRKNIGETYRIVLLCGDNLDDLADDFEVKNIDGRYAATENARLMFGEKYIILPNAFYGSWERILYDKTDTNDDLKAARRKAILEGY